MTDEEYRRFSHECIHELVAMNEACDRQFSISDWPRWDYNLDASVLIFSRDTAPKVIAEIQVVGTTSNESSTWMWGWANESLPRNIVDRMATVREFGEVESIALLTTDTLPNDEYLGWQLTAVAARLLNAKGAYRCPDQDGYLYVVYMEIRFAKEGELSPAACGDAPSIIECATHGSAREAFLCEHLRASPEQEWFSNEPCTEDPWPDSWCALCDLVFLAGEKSDGSADSSLPIKVVCHHCYEFARTKALNKQR